MRRHRFRAWSTLPADHKDYVFIYLWGSLWSLTYLLFTPTTTVSLITELSIILWASIGIIGGFLAFTGLIVRDNLIVERLGVSLLIIAPTVFTAIQLALVIWSFIDPTIFPNSPATNRIALVALGMWPVLFLNKRRRQLKTRVDIAKETPLLSETKPIPLPPESENTKK